MGSRYYIFAIAYHWSASTIDTIDFVWPNKAWAIISDLHKNRKYRLVKIDISPIHHNISTNNRQLYPIIDIIFLPVAYISSDLRCIGGKTTLDYHHIGSSLPQSIIVRLRVGDRISNIHKQRWNTVPLIVNVVPQ